MADAVGLKLVVYASKTDEEARVLQETTPNGLMFASDSNSIWFNNYRYAAHPLGSLSSAFDNLTDSSTSDDIAEIFGDPTDATVATFQNEVARGVVFIVYCSNMRLSAASMRILTNQQIAVTYIDFYGMAWYRKTVTENGTSWSISCEERQLPTSVVDNLTSTATNAALSANQGRELKELIDQYMETDNIYESSFSDMSTTSDIGGIESGTSVDDLAGKTYDELFDMIFFPELQPTVVAPSASISFASGFSSAGVYEVGATAPAESNFNTSFNRGICTVQGKPDMYRAGALIDADSYIYYGGSTSTQTLPTTIALGTMQYNYHAAYEQGDTLITSWGNTASVSPNPLPAGSVNSSALYIYGTYPYFCNGQDASSSTGVSTSDLPTSVTEDTKLTLQRWTVTLIGAMFASEASTGTRLTFDYPSAKNVTKVEFYNTVSGAWEDFGSANWTTSSIGNKTIQGNEVAYSRVTTTGSLSGAIQLRFTVANA